MNGEIFGKIIKAERERQGMTQVELARKSGFTREAISYWEHQNRAITLENADRLLKALGIEIIIGGKQNE